MERKWWTLIAVCIGTFMLLIDVTIVNVALPDIQTALKSTFSDLQWVIDAYSLMLAALLLTTGSLADLFGRRRVFVIGLVIFTGSSLMSGLATTPLFLNLARGAQGVGGAAMFSTSLALLANSFRGRERGTAFGVWGGITGLAVAIGPVVGGALTTEFGWRWIFLVNVPIGVIGVIVALLKVEESRQPGAHHPDWLGAITFSGALAALVYALIQGESKGWGSTEIVSCLAGAGALLLIFLIVERIQKAPMFDLSLFRNPTFSGGSIVAFSLSAGMFALLLYLTLYLQDVLGFSALHTGLRLLFLSGGILLTSTVAGRLTTRVPIRLLIAPGLGLVGVSLLMMRGLTAASGWQHLIPGFIVGGAGVGLINPPLASTAVGVVEPARAGMASGINSTFRQVGIATGIAGLGAVFSHVVRTKVVGMLSVIGAFSAPQAHALAASVAQGSGVGAAVAAAPVAARQGVVNAIRVGFVGGLNEIFLIAAILSFAAGLLSLVLIRNKDFEASAAYQGAGTTAPPVAAVPEAAPADPVPADVIVEAPAEPVAEAPAEPVAEAPAEPVAEAPAEPVAEAPAEPVAEAPAEPVAEAPAEPVAEAPAEPVAEVPAEPVAEVPAEPPAEIPAAPVAEPDTPEVAATALQPEIAVGEPAAIQPAAEAREQTGEPGSNGSSQPIAAGHNGGLGGPRLTEASVPVLAERSYAVALAAEQAAADCSAYIERILTRRQSSGGDGPGEDLALVLRDRLNDLADQRRRLVGALREHTQAVGEHLRAAREHTEHADRRDQRAADTRQELYGVIAGLAALADEARATATAAEPGSTD